MSDNETPVELEQSKPSKLAKVGSVVTTAGIIAIPVGLTVAATVASLKMGRMQLETARLNLETAKLKNS